MWRRSCRFAPSILSFLHSPNPKPQITHFPKPPFLPNPQSPSSPFISKPLFSSSHTTQQTNSDTDDDSNALNDTPIPPSRRPIKQLDPQLLQNIETILNTLRNFDLNPSQCKHNLENCGVPISHELVSEVLSRLRNDWAPAFTFFLWASKFPGYAHSVYNYHLMISTLAKMRHFDTAWTLVDEMRRRSLVTSKTLLILIRKYCAAHDVAKAISVFYSFKKYGFELGIDEFQGLLSALCRYKNVSDAESLLLCNEGTYPFETKSFNIVLNGWCNVLVYVREAKRFWREMSNRGVDKDVVSYGSMISCYSKAGNLNDVLKLFNRMKEMGIVPDLKVYNAMVYALAKGKCIEQARNLFKTMEGKGVIPNAVTYNSLIRPLCKARRFDEARDLFDELLEKGFSPSTRTYHTFFDVFRTVEDIFDLLDRMKRGGCMPVSETYIMLIRKLSRWRQFDSVFRLWNEMRENGVSPDRSAYIVLIHGLFLNGKLEDAFKFYAEMKAKGFPPEPRTQEMFQAWRSGKDTLVQSFMKELEGDDNLMGETPRGSSNTSSPSSVSGRKPTMGRDTR